MQHKHKRLNPYLPILGALFGGVVFLIIFGPDILNPTFIGWTMEGDAAQHFLGWHFYRSEPWTFPLGLIKGYQYPQGTSLVYTDSIPLVAIPLKLLGPLLPDVLQYHGLWLLLTYLLQGCVAALLLRRLSDNPLVIIFGTLFFILSPILVQRAGFHESLTSHWIILAALYLYFQTGEMKNRRKWVVLLLLASVVHFYLMVMALFIFAAYVLRQILENGRRILFDLARFVMVTAVLTAVLMWVVGYFVFDFRHADAGGVGTYSMNLLSPINAIPIHSSVGKAVFLPSFPLATPGQIGEGFNYLGFGLVLLIIVASLMFLRRPNLFSFKRHLPLILVGVILFGLSLSNKITLADRVLLEIDLPFIVEKGLGLIRSTGRLFWPVSYLLMLAAIAVVVKRTTTKWAVITLFVLLAIQIVDLSPWYLNIDFDENLWETPLQSDQWQQIMEETEHIVFMPPRTFDADIIPFAFLAASNGNTINVGVTARTDYLARDVYTAELINDFEAGVLEKDTFYVIRESTFADTPIPESSFDWKIIDGYTILAPRPE